MNDWLLQEEVDIEAMIEAISSLNNLFETEKKMAQKLTALDSNLNNLKSGRKSFKNLFSLKSSTEEANSVSIEKSNIEKSHREINQIIKISVCNMESTIKLFRIEKLSNYYKNLKLFSELQKSNSAKIESLWDSVAEDKNIQKLMNN